MLSLGLWETRFRRVTWAVILACLAAAPAYAASPEAYRLNESAVRLTAQGRYEEAAALAAQALRLSPDDEVIRRNLARLRTVLGHRLLQAGLLEKAGEQYQAALEVGPEEPAALLGLGDVELRRRQPRAAIEAYRRAVGLDPQNPDAHIRLGEAFYNQGDLEAALSAWEWALALRPKDDRLRGRVDAVRGEARIQSGYRSRESQHFTAVYEGARREDLGGELLQILERAYADVGYELGAYPPHDIQVIFYSDADFTGATGLSSRAGGFYHRLDGKIRIALRGLTAADSVPVLYHEYTHALIYTVTRGKTPPRWMDEGLAVHMERQRVAGFRQEAGIQARAGRFPSLDASPYVHGSVAVEYLIERHGMGPIRQLLRRLGEGLPFARAFQETFRMDLAAFQQSVHDLLARGN